jgi:hypothetical protein
MKQSPKLAILSKFQLNRKHHFSTKHEKTHCTENLTGQIQCRTRGIVNVLAFRKTCFVNKTKEKQHFDATDNVEWSRPDAYAVYM